jgi:hypothetical protein
MNHDLDLHSGGVEVLEKAMLRSSEGDEIFQSPSSLPEFLRMDTNNEEVITGMESLNVLNLQEDQQASMEDLEVMSIEEGQEEDTEDQDHPMLTFLRNHGFRACWMYLDDMVVM